jgi:tetratricopeptide (TPR) repeat protein
VEAFNQASDDRPLYVTSTTSQLTEGKSTFYFAYLDTLSRRIETTKEMPVVGRQLLLRSVAYSAIQNFERAIDDLGTCLQIDSTQVLAYWQRAVCQSKVNDFQSSQGTNVDMKRANVLSDLSDAIHLSPQNAYLYYNRGNIHVQRQDYERAMEDYNRAIELDANLAEAYYNRGLVYAHKKQTDAAIADLSKAGEFGLYTAYSVIKQLSGSR